MSAVFMSMFLLCYKMNTVHFIHQHLGVPSRTRGSGSASRFSASHTEGPGHELEAHLSNSLTRSKWSQAQGQIDGLLSFRQETVVFC